MAQVYRCAYESTCQGVQIVNTFHVVADQASGETGPSSADSVRDALHAALTTKYRAILGSDTTVGSLVVREELDPGSLDVPAMSVQTIGLAGTGGIGPPRAPLSLTQVVAFKTDAAVRGALGRMFIPVADANTLTSSGQFTNSGAWVTAVNAFFDELK